MELLGVGVCDYLHTPSPMMMLHHSDQRQQLPLLLKRLILFYKFGKIVFLFIHTFDPFIMTIRIKEDPRPSLNQANPVLAEDADEDDANLVPFPVTASEEEEEKAKKLKAIQDLLKDDKQKGEKEEKEGTSCCSLKGCFWCLVTLPCRFLAAS